MATKNLVVNADGFGVKSSGGTNLGAGAGGHLVVGLYSGYIFRSFLKFTLDWTGVTKITSATLEIRNSTQSHIAFGSSPRVLVDRVTVNWSEGSNSCESGYSASNALVYPGPGAASTERKDSGTLSTTESAWQAIDITAIVNAWAPASVLKSDGNPGGAQANYGIRLMSYDEASTSRAIEFTSRDTSSDPYIHLVYETNQPPNAPTLTAPSGDIPSTPTTPTFAFSVTDPDAGDTIATYDIQVSTDSTFATVSHWNAAGQTSGLSGTSVSRAYAGTALVGGTVYYWRARGTDNNGAVGPWSASKNFNLNRVPTIANADLPYAAANHVADLWNLADLVTAFTPKPQWTFTPRDPDGEAIVAYDVLISGQTVETVTGNWASGTAITHKSARTLVNGTAYTVQFRAKDASGEYGPYSTAVNFKVWYMQAIYEWATGTTSGWTVTTTGALGRVQLLYRSATGAAGAGAGAWKTSLPTSGAYLNIMVRTNSYGSGTPARPGVSTLKITYNTTATLPYNWTTAGLTAPGSFTSDDNVHRYGTSSVKMDLDAITVSGGSAYIYQDVPVDPGTDYALSVWVLGAGLDANSSVQVRAYKGGSTATADLLAQNASINGVTLAAIGDWTRMVLPITSAQLKGYTSIRVLLIINRTTIPGGQVWWDAAMLSEGIVAPVWTPALVGNPVVLDANGVVIDAGAGAIFRLLGSAGGARDIVELGAKGLTFGGDEDIYSENAAWLRVKANGLANAAVILESASSAYSQGFYLKRGGDANYRAYFIDNVLNLGDGAAAADTNLYRGGANLLKTDDVMQAASFTGKNPIVRVYSAGATWNIPATGDLSFITVEVIGAGGAGGGVAAAAAGAAGCGGGGGGGGLAQKLISASALSGAYTVTVGAGGVGVVGGAGGAGTASSFVGTGANIVGNGGGGAVAVTPTTGNIAGVPGAGGTGSGGDLNATGGDGSQGRAIGGAVASTGIGGGGALYGGIAANQGVGSGAAGKPHGGGGSGGYVGSSGSALAGGTGADGRVIVVEYYAP